MVLEDAIEEEEGKIRGCKGLDSGNEVCSSREPITNDPNGIATMGDREFDYEIHSDTLPWTIRDLEGLE